MRPKEMGCKERMIINKTDF